MDLNTKQQEAVGHEKGPLLIIAGAGSGKTRTLTSRLTALIGRGVPASEILAITFTNKAAKEMRSRVQKSGIPTRELAQSFIGTFHSLGARILKDHASLLGRNASFSIFDDDDSTRLIKQLIKEVHTKKPVTAPMLSATIAEMKHMLLPYEELEDDDRRTLAEMYEKRLQENNAFDFGDLIEKVVHLFKNHPEVLRVYHNRFSHILVDEYQDVNQAQYDMIRLLGDAARNVTVVGDDAQAIYGWRHADFRNFLRFEKEWPGSKTVALEQNYRSSGNIIRGASELIKNNTLQKEKNLWTENPDGELIEVTGFRVAEQEAEHIVDTIMQIRANAKQKKSVGILYRTNAQSRALEQELIQSGIPYRIFGGVKFYERKEIKDIIACLRYAQNPRDSISHERIHKTFLKRPFENLSRELPLRGRDASIIELLNFIIQDNEYFEILHKKFPNAAERIENVNELISFAGTFKRLDEFLEQVSLLQSADEPSKSTLEDTKGGISVELMTIHMAKGLEFDEVFVAGCSEGLLPHQRSYGALEELEEERRLMYVAMTRAREKLHLSFYRIPSRFLYELPPELTSFSDHAGINQELPDDDIIYIDD